MSALTAETAPPTGVLSPIHRSPLTKAIAVLRTLAAAREESLTIRSISQRTGLPLSTTGKVCARLREDGALERHADGTLSLAQGIRRDGGAGLHVRDLGRQDRLATEVRQLATPFLVNLHLLADARVVLRDWSIDRSRIVAQIATAEHGPLRVAGPLTAAPSSGELALLAFAHPARLERALAGIGAPPGARVEGRIRAAVRDAVRVGHVRHSTPAGDAVAVPVFSGGQFASAALCITPNGPRALPGLLDDLHSTAAAIGRVVRHHGRAAVRETAVGLAD